MTTKFLDNKIALSKFYCRGVAPQAHPPLTSANFVFIVVLPSLILGSAAPGKFFAVLSGPSS